MKRHVRAPGNFRLAALPRLDMLSADLAIGTASAFVFITAAASLVVDKDVSAARSLPETWSLRGSVSTIDTQRQRGALVRVTSMSARL